MSDTVPPILSFSMGTLGFLGEWKFQQYKRAFREAYVSGLGIDGDRPALGGPQAMSSHAGQKGAQDELPVEDTNVRHSMRGKVMGQRRTARILLRNRLKIGMSASATSPDIHKELPADHYDTYAMNEVIIHRGRSPHLAIVEVFIGGRFLTEAVADGMIIATPTGSTAYSLSSGGSIIHPLVSSLLLTPICPRSLSFRPLVLPANPPITLRLSEKNRIQEVDVSIDGKRKSEGLKIGMELRVGAENVRDSQGRWVGGVPSVVGTNIGAKGGSEDSWVGGLNSLLKFNYPMGEE